MPLSIQLQGRIESFLADYDLGSLYREYNWARDTWENGFPEMRQLEEDLAIATKHGYLTKTLIVRVARWGRLKNLKRVQCPEHMRISLYDGDDLAESPGIDPSTPLRLLRETIKRMGPTYLSKVLMFSRHRFCFSSLSAESNTRPYDNTGDPWTFTGDSAEQAQVIEKTLARFEPLPEGYAGQFWRFYHALQDDLSAPVTLADGSVTPAGEGDGQITVT